MIAQPSSEGVAIDVGKPAAAGAPAGNKLASRELILTVNPGSTSTKVALFHGEELLASQVLHLLPEELSAHPRVIDQLSFRQHAVLRFLLENRIDARQLDAVVGRGGILRPMASGTYSISQRMIDDLQGTGGREHASNLGAPIAREIAAQAGCPAFVVDPVSVDEFTPLARISGLPEIERKSLAHALNLRAAARRAAATLEKDYREINLVIVHMGGGISVAPFQKGRQVDVNQALDGTGPFSPERAGGLPVGDLLRMAYAVPPYEHLHLDYQQFFRKIVGQGGLVAHLGTNDARVIEDRIEKGDDHARLIYEAMAYQTAKEIGGMATVLHGDVDAIVLTGGLVNSALLVDWLTARVRWIAQVLVYPGEDEMLAMAQGAIRVLRREEGAREY